MGAPLLLLSSIRRKSNPWSNKTAVAPPPPTSAPTKIAGLPTTRRPSTKNNVRSASSGKGTENTIRNNEGGGLDGGGEQLPPSKTRISKPPHNNNGGKQKRSMRLSIAPDTESESMQVVLIPESPPTTNKSFLKVGGNKTSNSNRSIAEEEDCIYTVGSVEYMVKHNGGDEDVKKNKSKEGTTELGGGGNKKENCLVKHVDGSVSKTHEKDPILPKAAPIKTNVLLKDCAEVAAGGGDSGKKKSKMGSFFKKSPKKQEKGGGGDDDDKEQGSNNTNNDNNGDQNGDKKNDKDDSKDDNNDEKKESGDNNGPHASFGPHRIEFAKESTLPLHPGSESTAPSDHPSWTPVDGTEFKVRTGPNYPKTGKKEASAESLYEVYCVRYFRSEKRTVGGATRIMPLPEMGDRAAPKKEGNDEKEEPLEEHNGDTPDAGIPHSTNHHPELKNTKIPDVLVVHFMLPYEPPNMFKQKDDGPGGECVYYLRPSRRFLDEISGRTPMTPAVRLFKKWCEQSQGNKRMRSRFKCMALVRDLERHNFGLLKSYNGKPVLITESGRVCSGFHGDVSYLEMTANVHNWAFMAKKGFVSLIPKFENMQMEIGFTIEAHTDAEMPECMLGSTVLSRISDGTGPMITREMQEPVHEHQS